MMPLNADWDRDTLESLHCSHSHDDCGSQGTLATVSSDVVALWQWSLWHSAAGIMTEHMVHDISASTLSSVLSHVYLLKYTK